MIENPQEGSEEPKIQKKDQRLLLSSLKGNRSIGYDAFFINFL